MSQPTDNLDLPLQRQNSRGVTTKATILSTPKQPQPAKKTLPPLNKAVAQYNTHTAPSSSSSMLPRMTSFSGHPPPKKKPATILQHSQSDGSMRAVRTSVTNGLSCQFSQPTLTPPPLPNDHAPIQPAADSPLTIPLTTTYSGDAASAITTTTSTPATSTPTSSLVSKRK